MLDKAIRLNEVYEHLHENYSVHTKAEFADAIQYARSYISSALNGNEKYLTDKLFKSICKTYQNIFDLNYLLTGEGTLLTLQEQARLHRNEVTETPDVESSLNNIVEMQRIALSALERQNEVIKQMYEKELESKDLIIAEKDSRINDLQSMINDKNEMIAMMQEKIESLKAIIQQQEIIPEYPFPPGVAEHKQLIK